MRQSIGRLYVGRQLSSCAPTYSPTVASHRLTSGQAAICKAVQLGVDARTQNVEVLVVDRVVSANEIPETLKKPDSSKNVVDKILCEYDDVRLIRVEKGSAMIVLNQSEDVLGVSLPPCERSLSQGGVSATLNFKKNRLTTLRGAEAGGQSPDDHILMMGHQGDKFARNRDDNGVRRGRGGACVVYATPNSTEQEMFEFEESCLKYLVDDAEAEMARVESVQTVAEQFNLGNNGFFSIAPFTRPLASVQCVGISRNYSSGVHGDPDSAPGGFECILQYASDDYDGTADFLQFYWHGRTLVVVYHRIPDHYSCVLGVGAHMTSKSDTHNGCVLGFANIVKPDSWTRNMNVHREYNKRVSKCIKEGVRPEFVRDPEHAAQPQAHMVLQRVVLQPEQLEQEQPEQLEQEQPEQLEPEPGVRHLRAQSQNCNALRRNNG